MLNTTVLDVAIGLVFVYLLLSLVCTALLEIIAAFFNLRARNLEDGIRSLFSDGFGPGNKAFVEQIYDHGLIAGLYRNPAVDLIKTDIGSFEKPTQKAAKKKLPSYIHSRTFTLSLIDILNSERADGNDVVASIKHTLSSLPDNKARQALLTLVADADGKADVLRQNFENWYNSAMDRVSGWYKKRTQYILLGIGLIIAVAVNADSILIAKTLYVDPGMRSAVVASATNLLTTGSKTVDGATPTAPENLSDLRNKLTLLNTEMDAVRDAETTTLLPIGWKGRFNWRAVFLGPAIPGWLLTGIALSLGAPFWFDLLNKFMVVRSTIKPQEKSALDKSKD